MKSHNTCRNAMMLTSNPPQPGCMVISYGKFDLNQCQNCEHYEPTYPRADIEPIRTQTDCKKCIYHANYIPADIEKMMNGGTIEGCRLQLRMTKPICPLFDDGKETKQ